MISYAQNAEDVVLGRLFDAQETGTWIDVGAGHPVDDSVTKHFAEAAWHGINIEPHPGLFAALELDRPRDVNLQAAAGEAPGHAQLWVGADEDRFNATVLDELRRDGWEPIDVPVVTVRDLVHEHGFERVDFLKIDAEGAEAAVLRGTDLTAIRPRVLVIEAIHPVTHRPTHAEWESLVLSAGYSLALFDGINRFYAAADDDAALTALAAPACALDSYTPAAWHRRMDDAALHAGNLEKSRDEAERYALSLEKRIANIGRELEQLVDRVESVADRLRMH